MDELGLSLGCILDGGGRWRLGHQYCGARGCYYITSLFSKLAHPNSTMSQSLSFLRLSRHSPIARIAPRTVYLSRGFVRPHDLTKHQIVTSLTPTCLSCGAQLPTRLPVCPSCNFIARVDESVPYHELLGLPYDPNPFIVDTALLKRRFLDAQRICHPDAWATKSEVLVTTQVFTPV